MAFKILRRDFERLLTKGVELSDMPIECPEEVLIRWLADVTKRIDSTGGVNVTSAGRRINNFCLGSDPEFVFVDPNEPHKMPAAHLGLKPGLAAGCDQNQRLAELRCWPTTSAVEHVAGILAALRWMYRLYPACRRYEWKSGGWFDNDGIGGHVHFGRKRPNRAQEVQGLDGLAVAFQETAFFSHDEWRQRQRGDAHRQQYGGLSDIRPQLHGYEYRTLPSWLDNPTRAFMVLTLSKLAVIDPDLTSAWLIKKGYWTRPQYFRAFQYLANYYAGRDDDAALLKLVLTGTTTRKAPFHPFSIVRDFRSNWGFTGIEVVSPNKTNILSACVQPQQSEINEVLLNITNSLPLTYVENTPTFKNELPKNYEWLYDMDIPNIARQGVGDVVHNLVCPREWPMPITFGGDRFLVSISVFKSWSQAEQNEIREMFPGMIVNRSMMPNTVQCNREMTTVTGIRATRKFLLKMGLFPLWTVDSVQPDSYEKFLASRPKAVSKKPLNEERNL